MPSRSHPADLGQALRGWHQTVGWRTLLGVSTLILLLWAGLMSVSVWWLRENWQALATLRHVPLALSLPRGIQAQAQIESTVHVRLDMERRIQLPIDQDVHVTMQGPLQAQTQVSADVPVSTAVAFEAEVPVDTQVQAEIPVLSWLPAMTVNVPVHVTLPLKMVVPVKVNIPLRLNLVVSAEVPERLAVPVHALIHAKVPLHADLRAVVTRQADFSLDQAIAGVPMWIEQTQIKLPFKDVSWVRLD